VLVGFRSSRHSLLSEQIEMGAACRLTIAEADRSMKERYALAGHHAKHILLVPMMVHDHGVGVVELADRVDGAPFSDEDIASVQYMARKFAEYFAQQAMVAPDFASRTHVA
jgi:GAF domain-containing protein